MRRLRARIRGLITKRTARVTAWLLPLALIVVALAAVMSRGGAPSAPPEPALNGDWAPFARCPVDDPRMRAADGRTAAAFCIASDSSHGSMKLGSTTTATGMSTLQFGIVGPASAPSSVVPPASGAIVALPVDVPGGLLGLICPSNDIIVSGVCRLIVNNTLDAVSATVESAGRPRDFNLAAATRPDATIVTIPAKVHLQNLILGSDCYIGSDANPILLRLQNVDTASSRVSAARFDAGGAPDPNGPLALNEVSGLTQADDTFAVPAATGCGPGGSLDGAINAREGLPSPAGHNDLVLDDVASYEAGLAGPSLIAPNAGRQLSRDWHAAVCNSACPTPASAASATPPTPAAAPGG